MTTIFDMVNGDIQSAATLETGNPEAIPVAGPPCELQLAVHELAATPDNEQRPPEAIHLIRRLLATG